MLLLPKGHDLGNKLGQCLLSTVVKWKLQAAIPKLRNFHTRVGLTSSLANRRSRLLAVWLHYSDSAGPSYHSVIAPNAKADSIISAAGSWPLQSRANTDRPSGRFSCTRGIRVPLVSLLMMMRDGWTETLMLAIGSRLTAPTAMACLKNDHRDDETRFRISTVRRRSLRSDERQSGGAAASSNRRDVVPGRRQCVSVRVEAVRVMRVRREKDVAGDGICNESADLLR
jgi:hypothetical protein